MNIRYLIIAVLLMGLTACDKNGKNVSVEGAVEGLSGKYVEFKLLTSKDAKVMDSVKVGDDNAFKLNGTVEMPQFAALDFKNGDIIYLIIKPGDNITINANADDILNNYTVKGSNDSYRIKQLLTNHQKTLDKIADVIIAYRDSLEEKSDEAERLLAQRDAKREELVQEHREYTKAFIEDNLNSLASLMALYQAIGRDSRVLDISDDFKYFAMVDSSLMKKYPSLDAVKELNRMIVAFKEQRTHLAVGSTAPEIALPSPSGDTIRLSSMRGNYVLLDFWASWCAPCRQENPHLVEVYNEYNDEGFEIFQVSLDKEKGAWLKGIEEDNLDWAHVSDLAFWNSSAAQLYKVNQIPSNFLLDPDGTIIALNLRGEDLKKKLSEIFN